MSLAYILSPGNGYDLYARSFNGERITSDTVANKQLYLINANGVLPVASVINGFVVSEGDAAYSVNLPTYANFASQITGLTLGDQLACTFINTGFGGNFTLQIFDSTDSSVQWLNQDPILLFPGQSFEARFVVTSVTGPGVQIQVSAGGYEPPVVNTPTSALANGANSPLAAALVNGVFSRSYSAGDAVTVTLPTAASIVSYLGAIRVGQSFECDFYVDLSDVANDLTWSIAFTPGAGLSFYDGAVSLSYSQTDYLGSDGGTALAGTVVTNGLNFNFKFVYTGTNAFNIFYKVSSDQSIVQP